jgi:hypothetical protein
MDGRGQFTHAFSGDVYEFYSVSPEYFGYNFVSQQMHYSDCLLISYSSYMFRRMHVIIRESSFICPADLH